MKKTTIQLEALTCPSCLQKINSAVKKVDGVESDTVEVLFNSSRVRLNFNDDITSIENIEAAISKVGYKVLKSQVKDS